MSIDAKKILIVGPSWVGDMVMAQSLFIALKERAPNGIIDVLAPAWSSAILERMPQVRRVISMPIGHGSLQLGLRYRMGRQLAQEQYDQAIVLPNSLKSALIPFFASIPTRTGWRGEMRFGLLNDIRLLIKTRYPLMVQRFVALAYSEEMQLPLSCPNPTLQIAEQGLASLLEKFQLDGDRPMLALCPGAEFGPSKRWPEQHYAELAGIFIDRGWQVVLYGSDNDRQVTANIRNSLGDTQQGFCTNLAGETTLSEAIDLLSQAGAVVSNDSGLMHIAAALSRPLLVVYGSTSPSFTPPLSEKVAIRQLPVDCGPCFQRECPLEGEKKMQCMTGLSASNIAAALDELLS